MPQVNKIYFLDESIWIFFLRIYLRSHALFPYLIDQVFLFFLHNFSLLEFHWKHKNDILGLYEHSSRKKKHLHHCLASTFTQNKIHKNNKMHLEELLTTLVESSYFPGTRHITNTVRPLWHLMFSYNFILDKTYDAWCCYQIHVML